MESEAIYMYTVGFVITYLTENNCIFGINSDLGKI